MSIASRSTGREEDTDSSRLLPRPETMATDTRPQKITFAEMRDSGVRGLVIYYADYHPGHSIAISGERWPGRAALLLSCCRRLPSRFGS
jgi:hypothetical protein